MPVADLPPPATLLHQLVLRRAHLAPEAAALRHAGHGFNYQDLATQVERAAQGLLALGLGRAERVAVYLPKRVETIVALWGTAAAGGVFVPVNPLLKPDQVRHILHDCAVRVLVTAAARAHELAPHLADCPALKTLVLIDDADLAVERIAVRSWPSLLAVGVSCAAHRVIDTDMAAILYTSGSTGKPKGVVLSHRNLLAGAASVANYLHNRADDRILAVLPLSFDYGLSQLTTTFLTGACAVLMDYLLPRDIVNAVARERVTGLAGVPPLWMQLAPLAWPDAAVESLRYITNSGGKMPRAPLDTLRAKLPRTQVFLMYGLTEAFRSTYLPPEQVDARPDSIGQAIPNAEILVLREDGTPCAPGEPGELVHRGVHVAQGYWNDPEKTALRFRPLPAQDPGLPLTEIAVWSGDTVVRDEQGYLYFVGRRDDMIKCSGYRISPSEVEEAVYASGVVAEAAAIGVPHEELGQAVVVVAVAAADTAPDEAAVLTQCRAALPNYMQPQRVVWRTQLPRNPNGKIDRKALAAELAAVTEGA